MKRIEVALVGFGGYASVYRRLIAEAEDAGLCSLKAAVVPPAQLQEAEEAYRGTGTALYRSLEELFEAEGSGRVEALLLPVPIDLHADFALRAIAHGTHVLLEKPAAGTLKQAEEIRSAATQANCRVGVGFQYMYAPSILELKRIALERRYGRLREIRLKVLWARGEEYYRRTYWAGRLSVYGRPVNDCPLNNAAAHFLQNALFLSGESWGDSGTLRNVYAENFRANKIEGADTQFVRITTENGVRIIAAASHACRREETPVMKLVFDDGEAEWKLGSVPMFWPNDTQASEKLLREDKLYGQEELRRFLMRDMLRSFGEGREPWANIGNCTGHAAAVSAMLSAEFPIETVRDVYLERQNGVSGPGYTGGTPDRAVVIRGIEEAVDRAYRGGAGFRESGSPWAKQ